MKYKVLSHTADLKIKVYGKDEKELFSNALLGMSESMKPELKEEKSEREIEVVSLDKAALLVDFLNEVLYLSQTNKEAFFRIDFSEFSETSLKGRILGKKVKRFGEDIKAATYHNLNIRQKQNKLWEATILFDI